MNLCSLVVHTQPQALEQVRAGLEALPGVEVHGGSDAGKLIVTLEADDEAFTNTLMQINQLEGVLNAVMAYHYDGDDESMDEEVIRETDEA